MPGRKNRRSHKRLDVSDNDSYRVEFGYPVPNGQQIRMNLRDVSQAGVSFIMNRELPDIEIGQLINQVVVYLGRRKLRGDLVVAHISAATNGDAVCGALFYPSTDADLRKLKSTVADLLTP
jgi:hypothetical protein